LKRRIRYGLVFGGVVAIVAVIIVVVGNHETTNAPISNEPAQLAKVDKRVPRDPASVQVAREFVETAVMRKNLNWAYDHVHPYIKGLMTRAQWDKGVIPVIPFPAENAATAEFVVIYSYQTEVLFDVDLVARPGSNVRPHLDFYMGLRRAGDKPSGRWLVSYWEPNWRPPVPVTP
jgi:hypothetical protein